MGAVKGQERKGLDQHWSRAVGSCEAGAGAQRGWREERATGMAGTMSAGVRRRQLGEEPWASALMRCFIVGGRDRVWGSSDRVCLGSVTVGVGWTGSTRRAGRIRRAWRSQLRSGWGWGTAAVAVFLISPSAVHSARRAVTTVFQS